LTEYPVNCGPAETCQVCHDEDARWEKALSELGLRIVRFRNDEVEGELSAVVGKIREAFAK
jgi:very-short-patch-repair endonuclease